MSAATQQTVDRVQIVTDLQQRLDATQRELETTKAMLRLTELRLNLALGMPPEQLARTLREGEAHNTAANERKDA